MKKTAPSEEELKRITAIAALYYDPKKPWKQEAIASQYDIPQGKVSVYLKMAQEYGIIRTTVDAYYTRDLVTELKQKFDHIKEVIIRPTFMAPKGGGDAALLEMLGKACADYFLDQVHHGAKLGVSCGVAVDAFVRALGHEAAQGKTMPVNCTLYSLVTLLVETMEGITPASVVAYLTRWLPDVTGHAFHLPYDKSQGIDAYAENASLQRLKEALPSLDYYIFGIGYIPQQHVRSRIGRPHQRVSYEFNALIDRLQQTEVLQQLGAVGEAMYQPFNQQGELLIDVPALTFLRERMIYHPLCELQRQVDTDASIIAIAGGPLKHEAVRAALKGRFFNILVTDSETIESALCPDA